MIMEYVVGNKN